MQPVVIKREGYQVNFDEQCISRRFCMLHKRQE
ncbi:MAG: hypothetical protein GPOALKHO_000079 [Sodalis sp.]|nr:MAG: hypothetical protein GPOALKHO_000079 [Sodalis sp.]